MANITVLKRCTTCKIEKSLDCFYPRKNRPHGCTSQCKECRKKTTARWNQSDDGKKYYRERQRNVVKTPKWKTWYAEYKQRAAVREARRQQAKKRRATPESQAARLVYLRSTKGKETTRRTAENAKKSGKAAARKAISNRTRRGKLPKASTLMCACGQPAKHYHHHKGYAKNNHLDVIPVCTACHGKENRKPTLPARGR